ncbi:MAG: alpha/beta hydrolase family protein [Acetobacteraceae bacterium]
MRRRLFLAGGAALMLGSAWRAVAADRAAGGSAPGAIETRLAGRPGGGLPVILLPAATAQSPCPAIIFSHGLGGRAAAFTTLAAPWAAAGFLVLLPEHLDSLARGAPRRPSFAQLRRYALIRIGDIKALIDALPSLAARAAIQVAPGAIGVGGHSFGAWTAAVIGGAKIYAKAGHAQSFADPWPRAFLLLAGPAVPPGASPMHPFDGMASHSFEALTRPLLLIEGTRDDVPPGGPESYRERLAAYALSPPGNKYLALERNGTHMTTVGIAPPGDPGLRMIAERSLRDLTALSLPFWKGYVGGDRVSVAWLNGPAPLAIDASFLRFERRLG